MDSTSHTLQGALRPQRMVINDRPALVVAGATGVLGAEVLSRLAGSGRFSNVGVMACEPITTRLSGVSIVLAPDAPFEDWPVRSGVQVGVVMFEPPRLYYDRERALWTPVPDQLPALANWLRSCGVQTLVVVMPHVQGRLPDALKLGLATLDEHAVTAAGFERVLFVRSAQKSQGTKPSGLFRRTAAWMLSTLSYMVPVTEQVVRPSKIAEFIEATLRVLPAGTHMAPPELLWQAAQSGRKSLSGESIHSVVQAWLNGSLDASRP
ncbi:MAG: hypothetical protein V4454_20165 [Pseudomonadota bacterium]